MASPRMSERLISSRGHGCFTISPPRLPATATRFPSHGSGRPRLVLRTATKLSSVGFEATAVLTFGLRVRRLGHTLTFWETNVDTKMPTNILETLKVIDRTAFRNIYECVKILGVIPVNSCECERSMSAMRRLKTWLRSTTEQERFNGLALMHINNDMKIDNSEKLYEFARQNKTKMRFRNILDDAQEA